MGYIRAGRSTVPMSREKTVVRGPRGAAPAPLSPFGAVAGAPSVRRSRRRRMNATRLTIPKTPTTQVANSSPHIPRAARRSESSLTTRLRAAAAPAVTRAAVMMTTLECPSANQNPTAPPRSRDWSAVASRRVTLSMTATWSASKAWRAPRSTAVAARPQAAAWPISFVEARTRLNPAIASPAMTISGVRIRHQSVSNRVPSTCPVPGRPAVVVSIVGLLVSIFGVPVFIASLPRSPSRSGVTPRGPGIVCHAPATHREQSPHAHSAGRFHRCHTESTCDS